MNMQEVNVEIIRMLERTDVLDVLDTKIGNGDWRDGLRTCTEAEG